MPMAVPHCFKYTQNGTASTAVQCHDCIYEDISNRQIYTVFRITFYVFDYNSDVFWSIFIIFVPVESEMNILQFADLI